MCIYEYSRSIPSIHILQNNKGHLLDAVERVYHPSIQRLMQEDCHALEANHGHVLRLYVKTEEEQEGEGKKEEKERTKEVEGGRGWGRREGGNCSLTLVGIQRLHSLSASRVTESTSQRDDRARAWHSQWNSLRIVCTVQLLCCYEADAAQEEAKAASDPEKQFQPKLLRHGGTATAWLLSKSERKIRSNRPSGRQVWNSMTSLCPMMTLYK